MQLFDVKFFGALAGAGTALCALLSAAILFQLGVNLWISAIVTLALGALSGKCLARSVKHIATEQTQRALSDKSRNLSELTELLQAHLDLTSQTIELPVERLIDDLQGLQDSVAELNPHVTEHCKLQPLIRQISNMQVNMQFQDTVSQQMNVVRTGLKALELGQIPAETTCPKYWKEAVIRKLEAEYVMQDQWDLHNRHFGREVPQPTKDDGNDDAMVMF